MSESVLVDTGPLVAVVSRRDQYHESCVEQLRHLAPPLLTCWPVLTEAAWLLRNVPHALGRLLGGFESGLLTLADLPEEAIPQLVKFLDKYRSMGAQLADAAVVYLANEHEIRTIFTLDRRHFSVYRGKRRQPFTLVP